MKKVARSRRNNGAETEGILKSVCLWEKAILDAIPDSAWAKDREGRYVHINKAYSAALGLDAVEVVGKTDFDLWDRKQAEMFRQDDLHVMKSGERVRREEEVVSKTGKTVCVETIKSPIYGDQGELIGTTGIARDISGRRMMEQALRESESRYRGLTELLPNIVYEMDLEGRLTFLNRRGFEYFAGTPESSLKSKNISFLEAMSPADRERAIQGLRVLASSVGEVREVEYVMRKHDGTLFPALISAAPILRDGRPVGVRGTITDTTPLKKSEEALRASEQRYRELTDLLPNIVYEMDCEGLITFVNRRGLEYFRGPERANTETRSVSFLQAIAPEDRERAMESVRTLLATGQRVRNSECMMIKHDGTPFPALISAAPILRDGRPVGVRGTITDTTPLKKSEEALRASEQRYRELTDLLPAAVVEIEPDGRLAFANRWGLEQFGYTEADLRGGINALQCVADRDRNKLVERMQAILGGEAHSTAEYLMMRKDGSTFPALAHGAPIIRDGRAIGIRAIIMDISDLRRSERALAESEGRFRALAEGSSVGVFMMDEQLRFEYINTAGAEMVGRTREELSGKLGLADLVVREDEALVRRTAESQFSGGNPRAHFEVRVSKPDATQGYIEVYGTATVSNGRPVIVGTMLDITEQKLAEEARRESEEKYRMLMNDAADAIILVSQDGKIQEVNKSAERLFECTEKDLLGMNYSELHKGRESERIAATIEKIFADGYGSIPEFEVVTLKGRIVATNLTWSILRYRGKWLVQLTFRDITERKEAEEMIRRSEQTYRAIFENTGTANLIIEEDGTISLANAEFVKMTGCARTDIEGKMRWEDFVVRREDISSRGRLRLVSLHVSEKETHDEQVEKFRATIKGLRDASVEVVVTVAPIPGTTQKVCGLVDISELADAEQALRESEERYRALVEQSSEGIAIIDLRNRRIVEANETFLNILGYGQEDVTMLTIYDLLMETKGYIDNAIGRVIRKGRHFMGEQTLRGNNGTTVEVDMATTLVRYGDAMYVMLSTRDITEKKLVEETLRQAQKMEALGTLAGGIAHDLNNILQVVAGFAYQLRLRVKEDPTAANWVNEILGASLRGSNLTKSILTFSRKQPVYLQKLDVNNIVKGTERFLKRLVKENIKFHVQCPAHEVIVMADRIQVEQTLMNLVANANDAMPMGGTLLLQTSVEMLSEDFVKAHGFGKPGAYARISVADTGIGMDEETRGRIFEPFFSTKDTSKNTGLGMSVVYGIVKQHNGYITVGSQPGMGTTVDIYLPLVAVGETARSVPDEQEFVTKDTMQAAGAARTILVAEDQAGVRAFLKGLLEEAGYRVLEAEDGKKAVELFKAHKDAVDLLVLDLIMPGKDGKQAYDEMRAVRDDIKAVFLSGYSDEVTSAYGIENGDYVLVSKPVLPPVLLEKVRNLLENSHGHSTE